MGRAGMRAGTVWALVLGGVVILAAGVVACFALLCVDVHSSGVDCGSVVQGIFGSPDIAYFGGAANQQPPDCSHALAVQTVGSVTILLLSIIPVTGTLLAALWWGLRRIAGRSAS